MSTLTMKFGGTSVGSKESIIQAVQIVYDQSSKWDNIVVVVSAMSGVTNLLIEGAQTAANGDDKTYHKISTDLQTCHYQVVDKLSISGHDKIDVHKVIHDIIEEFSLLCHSVYVLGELTARAMDTISSLGERINARIVSAVLRQQGLQSKALDSTDIIVTDDNFQHAMPIISKTKNKVDTNLIPLLKNGIIPVVTGFMGATAQGVTTTLGRGGSDYIAAIIGQVLETDEVWIWTDVDGVMTAAPKIVPEAKTIDLLTYNEVGELAYFGAKVLHPQTIRPIVESDIPLWVKNTFNPTCPGTKIISAAENTNGDVKAVTSIKNLSLVTVEGRGMMGIPGIAARTFTAVSSTGANILMISQASSEQSICFVIPSKNENDVIEAIKSELSLEIARKDVDKIFALKNVVIISAVGAGMRGTPGVAANVFIALGQNNINIIAIAQGSSECSISLVVSEDDADNALRMIHNNVIFK